MRILAADMGATHSRFALFELPFDSANSGTPVPLALTEESIWLDTLSFASFAALLEGLAQVAPALSPLTASQPIDICAFAVAGAVESRHARLTNIPFTIDLDALDKKYPPMILLNDFSAHALSCLDNRACNPLAVLNAPLAPFTGRARQCKAAIGAGTGLGMAALVPRGTCWQVLASEGGHANFPFEGVEERAYQDFLLSRVTPYVSAEDVLSGKGLQHLHYFLTGQELSPSEIGQLYLKQNTPTQKWFARFYGRACRNWVLQTMPLGGLHIAGGIAAKNPRLIQSSAFAQAFHTGPETHAALLYSVPVYLNQNQNAALYGAAYAAIMRETA